jgi:hypothetical protein
MDPHDLGRPSSFKSNSTTGRRVRESITGKARWAMDGLDADAPLRSQPDGSDRFEFI